MSKTLLLCLVLVLPLAAENATADQTLARAVSLAGADRLEEAERVLLEGQSAFARDARFPIELAGIAWRRKQTERAKHFLRQGLHLDPTDPYANEFLGTVYLLDGNVYAALKYWNRLRRPVLSSVTFAPEPPLRPALQARLPAVSPGQLLTVARLAETERNLAHLPIFTEPRFDLAPAAGNDYALTVRAPVLTPPLSGLLRRALPLLQALPYQQVRFDWLNLHRQGISLNSQWRWDPDKRRIALTYRVPLLHHAFALFTDLRDEDWAVPSRGAVNIRSATLGAQVELDLGGGKRWTPSLLLSRHLFRQGDPDLYRNSTIWEMRNRFDLPRWRDAERRITVDSSLTARTGRIFSRESSRLVGAELDTLLRWYPQAKDDLYQVKGRLRGSVLTGNLPINALYATAMERDNDVWLRGHVGTRHGHKGNAPMGTRYVVAQSSVMRRVLRVPFLRVDAGPFFDLGNVGGEPGLGSRGFLYDTGVQADLTLLGSFRFSVVYGRDLRNGGNVFYTAISR